MHSRYAALYTLAVAFAPSLGCADTTGSSDRATNGVVNVALAKVPSDALCLLIVVSGTRTSERRFDLIPEQDATFSLGGLFLGLDTFSGLAYASACSQIDDASTPTWLSDPVTVLVEAGVTSQVTLAMRRNTGAADISVDFVDDEEDAGTPDSGLSGVTAIAAGGEHTCAVADSTSYCWGYNWTGQLGNGSMHDQRALPGRVENLAPGATAVAAGYNHTCAIVEGGVQCWGANGYGQLGDDSTTGTLLPVFVHGLEGGVSAIATGDHHTCAVVHAGVQCWGGNDGLQTGSDVSANVLVPTPVHGATSGVTAIAAGVLHSCAIADGAVLCWGVNSGGVLGNGTQDYSYEPVQALGLASGATVIGAGVNHTCAVVAGRALCWGVNHRGQLGNGSEEVVIPAPVEVTGLPTGVTAIAGGYAHTCAVVDGGAYCWGSNEQGQLGDGTMTDSRVPVQVQGLSSGVTAIAAGGIHTCALVAGSVLCWGGNENGQLGDGTYVMRSVPVAVH